MTKVKKFLFVAGAVLFGIVLLVVGFGEYRTSKKLQSEGKTVVGDVTDGSVHRGRRARRSYYLTVKFNAEAGQIVEKENRVSRDVYEEAESTQKAQVTYLPSDPSVCAFGPKVKTQTSALIFGAIALGVGVFTFFKGGGDKDGGTPANPEQELVADNSRYDKAA